MANNTIAPVRKLMLALKVAYWLIVLVIAWAYLVRPQDSGFIRQEITLMHLFVLAFPFSLVVDFWVLLPLIALNYLLDGFLSATLSGREFDHYSVLILGGMNAIAGYYQWFTIIPRVAKRVSPTICKTVQKIFRSTE